MKHQFSRNELAIGQQDLDLLEATNCCHTWRWRCWLNTVEH